MYELAIEHHHSGLSLSVHPDRGDAADALGAYSSTVDGFPRVLQLTGPHSSYEFIDPPTGTPSLSPPSNTAQPTQSLKNTSLPPKLRSTTAWPEQAPTSAANSTSRGTASPALSTTPNPPHRNRD